MKKIRYTALAAAILLLFLFPLWKTNLHTGSLDSGPDPKTPINIYVDGAADAVKQNGSERHPYTSIETARDHIRELKRPLPNGGITVWIKGGDYTTRSTIEWKKQDSGTAKAPITYRSFSGEKVSFSNAKTVKPSDWQPLSNEAKSRVNPAVRADQLVQLDVRKLGFHHIDGFAGGDSFTEKWGILQLIVDDVMQPVSQWPNRDDASAGTRAGWAVPAGILNERSFFFNSADSNTQQRMLRWQQAAASGHDVYLQGFWRTVWSPVTIRLAQIEAASQTLKLAETPSGGIGSKFSAMASGASESNPYRVGDGSEEWRLLNLLEEVDQPGEWAMDFKDGMLYYYPAKALNTSKTVIADDTDPILKINGASHLRFIGLELKNGMGNGITMQNTNNVTLAGLNIHNMSNGGIHDSDGKQNLIQSNDIYDTGSYGISVNKAGNRSTLTPSNTRITNNHIYNTGMLVHLQPLIIRESVGMRIDHNLLHDVPKDAIRYTNSNNLMFEYNEVHNTSLVESDTGAFYTNRDWTSYGNVLRYNFIHHNQRSNGFYFDDGDSGDIATKNIIQQSEVAFLMGGGHDNLAHNNLVIDSQTAGEIDDRGIARGYTATSEYARNLQSKNPTSGAWLQYGRDLMETYGYTTNLWSDILNPNWKPEYPNGSNISDNVFVQSGPVTLPKNGNVVVKDNLQLNSVADAQFYNAANLDFRTHNKQILGKFPDLNEVFPKIGLLKDQYRTRVITRAESGGLSNR